jgi:hypothetical protein
MEYGVEPKPGKVVEGTTLVGSARIHLSSWAISRPLALKYADLSAVPIFSNSAIDRTEVEDLPSEAANEAAFLRCWHLEHIMHRQSPWSYHPEALLLLNCGIMTNASQKKLDIRRNFLYILLTIFVFKSLLQDI